MNECIKSVHYERRNAACSVEPFTRENAQRVRAYHETWPGYSPTPLISLKNLAEHFGVSGLYVKDESYRFGLNAFKSLGGSYCLGRYIAEKYGVSMTFSDITNADTDKITFITATDGNHGRGIAWAAKMLGHHAVVLMPSGTVPERLANIQKLGADARITDMNYDDTVKLAADIAGKNGYVLVQDTSWEGYEVIPEWIMQGYLTMANEALEQLAGDKPTHVFLQAGVGSMAGALAGYFADVYGQERPITTIIEPNKADCIYRTARANDGELHAVTGRMDTIMAGLACGIPCVRAWELLKDCADNFVSMPDYVAAEGMRILANPLHDDVRIISGESGASTFGFVCELMRNESLDDLRRELGINAGSKILCFSTEGATDRENYRRIVWDGHYSSF